MTDFLSLRPQHLGIFVSHPVSGAPTARLPIYGVMHKRVFAALLLVSGGLTGVSAQSDGREPATNQGAPKFTIAPTDSHVAFFRELEG
ncbi:hypothetical protein [Cupriavidus necator]|uniref:hypothetical protein n=1 Tax=Cupriavidus necator TaxID=106590 RepID=UPI0012D34BD9|nr:hypothetical protein [Cupriavidus necator]